VAEKEKFALYRLWRPQTFDEVVAQKQVVYPLQQSVLEGTFSHALLFSGTRGTGKTSLAKIFAKAINCLNPKGGNPCNACDICHEINQSALMDINEIDAASHNSVEHMRRLTDEIMFTPVRARYKVYIIDEAHMLSTGAFNALLKTLEEPPEHAVFVLATTEPHRIPATIISRCQHYKFRRIPNKAIAERLSNIARDIDLDITNDALESIAHLSAGALRDAISLLDQSRQIVKRPVERDDVLEIAGRVPDEFLSETASSILFKNHDRLLVNIQNLVLSGQDLTRFVTDLGAYFRNLLVCNVSKTPEKLILLRNQDIETLRAVAEKASASAITSVIEGLAELLVSMRFTPDLRTTLEIGLLRLASKFGISGSDVKDRSFDPPSHSTKMSSTVSIEPKTAAPVLSLSEDLLSIPEGSKPSASEPSAHKKATTPVVVKNDTSSIDFNDEYIDATGSLSEGMSTENPMSAEPETDSSTSNKANPASFSSEKPIVSSSLPEDEVNTSRGIESLIEVWGSVLESLQQENRVEVALCARPAQVSFSGDVLNLHFRKNLTGQYTCLSQDDNRLEIESILSKRIGRPIQCTVSIGSKTNKNDQASDEQNWLSKLRDKVAPISGVPSPDPSHDIPKSRLDSEHSGIVAEDLHKDRVSHEADKANETFDDIRFEESLTSNNGEKDVKYGDQLSFGDTSSNNDKQSGVDSEVATPASKKVEPSRVSKREILSDDILQTSEANEQPWLIQLRQRLAEMSEKTHDKTQQTQDVNTPIKHNKLRQTRLSQPHENNVPIAENPYTGNDLLPNDRHALTADKPFRGNASLPYNDDYIPYIDDQDVPPLTDDDAPFV
jgi:DNA polymerase-3 subunit gamma/tau